MKDGPDIAQTAALMGDPARANMLMALMSGLALTGVELAREAGVTPSTASGHLSKLKASGLVRSIKQGRCCYFRIADPDVANAIEALVTVAARVATFGPGQDRGMKRCAWPVPATITLPDVMPLICLLCGDSSS